MQDKSPALKSYLARRRKKRDALWPEAEQKVYNPTVGGWARMPRTVPMISGLIDFLSDKEKPGRLYTVLWSHEYGDGLVEISDPAHLALEAGYFTSRAERTFAERMKILVDFGFLQAKQVGSREYGVVLLVDPHRVVSAMKAKAGSKIPEGWWSAFSLRCNDIGIDLAVFATTTGVSTDPSKELEDVPV
jgi:hypothetical protein